MESILTQEGVDVRVLILDDASPDNTPEVGAGLTHEDSRVTYVRHATNKGTSRPTMRAYPGLPVITCSCFLRMIISCRGALQRATALLDSHTEMGFGLWPRH